MKIRTLIIDDEPIARQIIREFIGKVNYLEFVSEADNPVAAKPFIEEKKIDLIFLDIQMPQLNGIEFLKSNKSTSFLTIITTAFPNYAVEGFELNILDYLVKPISFDRFSKACLKALQYIQLHTKKHTEDFFFVKTNNRIEKIEYKDLLYIESLGNYVTFFTSQGKLISYLTLKSLLEYLPADTFIQVHKSFIINKLKVKSIEGNEVKIEQYSVPVGKKMREHVLTAILGSRILTK